MKNDGGSAFPQVYYGLQGGMTLRDYFAAQALAGICANMNCNPTRLPHFENIAEDAYKMADAMLKEREK